MTFRYDVDDKPPLIESVFLGIQWFLITIPNIVVPCAILAHFHFGDSTHMHTIYLQKAFFITAIMFFLQTFWGHRLPIISGPAIALVVGIISCKGFDVSVIYTSIILCGVIFALFAMTRVFAKLLLIFTPRVVSVVLILMAFILLPHILNLIINTNNGVVPISNIVFSILFLLFIFYINARFKGVWQNTVIIWAMFLGTILYILIFKINFNMSPGAEFNFFSNYFKDLTLHLSFNLGVFLSIFISFVALIINDIGSVQAFNELLKLDDQEKRLSRGVVTTGMVNVASGFLGVLGPVNFPNGAGIVMSTRCASRYTLLPASFLLFIISFSPAMISILSNIPAVVIGSTFLFILCLLISAGFSVMLRSEEVFSFDDGLIIGFPVLIGTFISFLPPDVYNALPKMLRPILGNGFLMGILIAFVMEHIIYRKRIHK